MNALLMVGARPQMMLRGRVRRCAVLAFVAFVAFVACSPEARDTAGRGGSTGAAGTTNVADNSSGAAGATSTAGVYGTAVSGAGGVPATSGAGGTGALGGGGTSAGEGGVGGASGSGGVSNGGSASGGTAGLGTSSGGAGAVTYSPCPKAPGAPCAVLPLGDSITEGFGSTGAGYRVELFSQAVQNGKRLTFVGTLQNGPNTVQNKPFPKQHEGHDGYTIDSGTGHAGISGSLTDQAIANYHPDIVLLMIGTNDINGNVDVANAPNRIGSLLDDITARAPNALVVVATIIPVANSGTNQRVKTYNAALPSVVSSRARVGKHVLLVDNYAAFSQDPSYQTSLMYDYLHPNDAGYAVLGRSFYGALRELLQGT